MGGAAQEIEMARRGFGYGRWDAPYWFIGLEEGKGPGESADNSTRVQAWHRFEKDGLCDCRAFHFEIKESRLHCEHPRLAPTWRSLILLLKGFLDEDRSTERLRQYQRDRWGSSTGETCVIELSGTAAKGLAVDVDRDKFLEERIQFIRRKLGARPPTFVVMYGVTRRSDWERLVGCRLERDRIVRQGQTLYVMSRSPTARGGTNAAWLSLGIRLREAAVAEGLYSTDSRSGPQSGSLFRSVKNQIMRIFIHREPRP